MTDAAFAYHEDVATRSVQKKSAHHKKNGSAVAKLGNKPLTKKEIDERHGPVESYDLNRFMDFSTFKSMPHDLQIEYINRLQDKYDIGLMQLSKNLFNLDNEGLRTHLRINKILDKCRPNVKRGKTGFRQFLEDMDEQRRRDEFAKVIDISEAHALEESMVTPSEFITYDRYLKFSPEDRLKYVNGIIDKYNVSVRAVSQYLFGKDQSTLYVYFLSKKMNSQLSTVRPKYGLKCIERIDAFKAAVEKWKTDGKEPETPVIDIPKETAPIKLEIAPPTDVTPEIIAEQVEKSFPKPEPEIEEKPAEVPEETTEKYPESAVNYHDASFTTSYIREGLDMIELQALALLFQGKKVRVDIRIMEVA